MAFAIGALVVFGIQALALAQAPPVGGESTLIQRGQRGRGMQGVYKARIEAHWFANNTRCWYRNELRGGAKEFSNADGSRR